MTATLQPDDLCDCPLIDAEHTADECQQLRLDIEDEDQP